MRRLILLPLLILVVGLLVACSGREPEIAVESTALDLGDVPNGETISRDVTVRNTGAGILVVESITTSCGCTTASLEPMQLQPGESGVLHIEFDSGAHGEELAGPLVRQVFITSNDPARPEVTVELAANVTAPRQAGSR
jgi:hypothetical protein